MQGYALYVQWYALEPTIPSFEVMMLQATLEPLYASSGRSPLLVHPSTSRREDCLDENGWNR